jgi:hypothetical protein
MVPNVFKKLVAPIFRVEYEDSKFLGWKRVGNQLPGYMVSHPTAFKKSWEDTYFLPWKHTKLDAYLTCLQTQMHFFTLHNEIIHTALSSTVAIL